MRREDWDQRYAEAEALWTLVPNRFLVAEASSLPPGKALDLACGEGRNAIWLATLGWDVTGVDFSSVAIEKARARADRDDLGAVFHCADLLEYEPEADAYDLVLVFYLQVPAGERRIVLEHGAAALAPGGIFLLVGHHLDNLTEGVGGPSDPDRLYTPGDIVAQLPGLEVERAERVLRDVADSDRPAIDALVRARKPGA
jgi:SAM-dependent methyltransferase